MRSFSRRIAIAASLSVGLLAAGLSACSPSGGSGVTADDMSLGKADAPVTVVEYASVSCSHCARWNKDVFPAFKAKYIDTGKVRYVFREFITPPPQLAAAGFLLARCAGKDKYFGVLDQVFHAQDEIFRTGDIRTPLVAIAAQAGMTEQAFNACVSDEKALNALNSRVEKWATSAKITGTPTFDVNGKRLDGEQTMATFDAAIAAAAKK
jgi:protein-disulfide isomerase